MIGLKKEIEKRKDIMTLKKYNEMVSVANVAKILNIYYNKAKRKIDNGSFTVREALDVFEAIRSWFPAKHITFAIDDSCLMNKDTNTFNSLVTIFFE